MPSGRSLLLPDFSNRAIRGGTGRNAAADVRLIFQNGKHTIVRVGMPDRERDVLRRLAVRDLRPFLPHLRLGRRRCAGAEDAGGLKRREAGSAPASAFRLSAVKAIE